MKLSIVTPDKPEYEVWNNRGVNLRYSGKPSEIIPVATTEDLIIALQYAVDKEFRIAIRCGGHCLENFVSNPEIQLIIDISAMKGIRYDETMNAIEVKSGNTLGELYETLDRQWGIVLPCGEHPAVGVGGHIPGGAFGFLCRQHGMGVDYLYAIEILCINKDRRVEKIIATREASDKNRELWWAHTGGGAGNFGVVTRYWFRNENAGNNNPSDLLPKSPPGIETIELEWQWQDFDENKFRQLVDNYSTWCYHNSAPGSKGCNLYATLHLYWKMMGKIQLKGLLTDPTEGLAEEFIELIQKDHKVSVSINRKKMSWLEFALNPFPDVFSGPKVAFKPKDAFLLTPFTHQQIDTMYNYLTNEKIGGFIGIATYGGKVNTIKSDVTASAQRGAIMGTACAAGWMDPKDESRSVDWVRNCYSDLYKETGGVPVPNNQTGGCIIAHPDNDLADPVWNKSGVPWYEFYYQGNYPRLQTVKAKWDPCNIFHHKLSVQAD